MPGDALAEKIMEESVKRAGLWGKQQELHHPEIMRSGVLADGHTVHYLLNYSGAPARVSYTFPEGKELLSGKHIAQEDIVSLSAWGVAIIEEGVQ